MTDPIEQAARIAASIDWTPTCLPGQEKRTIVEQVIRVFADPAQQAELERMKADNARLRKRIHEAVDETQRRYAKYQAECDDHRNTVEFAKEWFAREGTDFGFSSVAGRALVIDLIEQRDLALWLHAEAAWQRDEARSWADCESSNVNELAAERDALQARIDAALAEIATWWGTAQRGDRVLMAVNSILRGKIPTRGDQPTAPNQLIPPDDPCQNLRCSRLDGRCVGMHCARCGEPCGAQGHTCSTNVTQPTEEADHG